MTGPKCSDNAPQLTNSKSIHPGLLETWRRATSRDFHEPEPLSAKIRTVALVGHGAAGKTTLAESLLAASGAITSRGSVEKGNTVCDFDPIEKELGHSLQSSLVSFDRAASRFT